MIEPLGFEEEEVLWQVMADCGRALTFRQFNVIYLYVFCGMTQEQVGRALGIEQSTVSRHFRWALEKVRKVSRRYT